MKYNLSGPDLASFISIMWVFQYSDIAISLLRFAQYHYKTEFTVYILNIKAQKDDTNYLKVAKTE